MLSLKIRSQKKKLISRELRKSERLPLTSEVYICRKDKKLIRCDFGDISEGGLFLRVDAKSNDLQKGRKIDIVMVSNSGTVKETKRISGIILRVTEDGIGMVTYDKNDFKFSDSH